jgi:hypothetical protein
MLVTTIGDELRLATNFRGKYLVCLKRPRWNFTCRP